MPEPDCQKCPAADVCRKIHLWNVAHASDSEQQRHGLAKFPWEELDEAMRFLQERDRECGDLNESS